MKKTQASRRLRWSDIFVSAKCRVLEGIYMMWVDFVVEISV